ncbi:MULTISPECIES: LuxR C-terminal-related transcriptional regulator [unclassified Crossiella]|uniref:LuxR C-terminal-related transcriptional regulator n=1 Tax=unclassified Crossiella TaxID=2620835 RepID=UPI001FFE80CF|nr:MULTISPECIES: LuxR C-terminal-related transcriptional regulator [unclassified Crossiella]MCK2244388.1 LuxR C-terminal-related transcriptional regulator [Crossiella sp. S99.2]MCK2257784.1 LuxR C-terminal-related transcriptional regulator [Crossiella sp. S99.1]
MTSSAQVAETEPGARMPVPAGPVLRRDRLESIVDIQLRSGAPQVLLVFGPAGTGKTTLLASWARRRVQETGTTAVRWATITARDNEPEVLAATIGAALSGGAGPEPAPVCLVLDEVHELLAPQALRELERWLRELPAGLRVVLLARFPPPLGLARLRVEGRLREIGMAELAFTTAEAAALLTALGHAPTEGELDLLMRHTEGWAAGLRLAAIARAGEPDSADRLLADYLRNEVLGAEPALVRELLTAVSVCEGFTVELAAALSGLAQAGHLVDRLHGARGLLRRTDGDGQWYRCHPLLRHHLHAELTRLRPERAVELHRLAADWFLAAGARILALEHAVAGQRADLAARLVAEVGLTEVLAGRARALAQVLARLPTHVLARPSVALVVAATALATGDTAAAEEGLRRIGHPELPLRSPRLRILSAAILLWRNGIVGEEPAAELLELAEGDSGAPEVDLLVLLVKGGWALRQGDLPSARSVLNRARRLTAAGERRGALLHVLAQQAIVAAVEGELGTARALAASAVRLAEEHEWTATASCGTAHLVLAAEAQLRLAADTARAHLAAAAPVCGGDPLPRLAMGSLAAVLRFETGADPHRALLDLCALWTEYDRPGPVPPWLAAWFSPMALRMALQVGELGRARQIVEHGTRLLGARAEAGLLRAVMQAHRGRLSQARRSLAPVLTGRALPAAAHNLVDAWLLECLLADRLRADRHAHRALCRALALAEPRELLRPFRAAGAPIRDLLARNLGRYGRLEHFATAAAAAPPVERPAVTATLTSRELDLLAELPSMRTAEEIADSLYVSVNTVKTHLRGIYRKLGVNQRRDAVIAARRCGLL